LELPAGADYEGLTSSGCLRETGLGCDSASCGRQKVSPKPVFIELARVWPNVEAAEPEAGDWESRKHKPEHRFSVVGSWILPPAPPAILKSKRVKNS